MDRRAIVGLSLAVVSLVACGGGHASNADAATGVAGAGGASGAAGTTGAAGASGTTGAAGNTGTAGSSMTTGAAGTGAATRAPFDLSRVDCLVTGDGRTSIALVNHCGAHVTFGGSQNQSGELDPDHVACRDVGSATASLPAIRYWGFTAPDPGLGHYTLAEFTFNTSFNDFDWYNISHVDAHNLPMQIVAAAQPKCRTLTCADSLLANCPMVGQYKDPAGDVIACVSPQPNDPQSPVARYFDQACPDAYSWSGDDQNSVVACAGEDYIVVFCP